MRASGNIGEWSEPYVFLRLAADGYIPNADQDMHPSMTEKLYIREVARDDVWVKVDNPLSFIRMAAYPHGGVARTCSVSEISARADRLLSIIKNATGKISDGEFGSFLDSLGFRQLKNPVSRETRAQKKDIVLKIEDSRFGYPSLGFSVKSHLGGAPTLLNASEATNIVYKVEGLNNEDVWRINSIDTRTKIQDRCAEIKRLGGVVSFDRFSSGRFEENLSIIDGDMPQIIAEIVLRHYLENEYSVDNLLSYVSALPRFSRRQIDFCKLKYKRFLRACALGLKPADEWHDTDDATGGYITVLSDGGMMVFYIYDRALFDEYLFKNTKFERASTTRHGYMSLYTLDGKVYVKLNLQIRFIN